MLDISGGWESIIKLSTFNFNGLLRKKLSFLNKPIWKKNMSPMYTSRVRIKRCDQQTKSEKQSTSWPRFWNVLKVFLREAMMWANPPPNQKTKTFTPQMIFSKFLHVDWLVEGPGGAHGLCQFFGRNSLQRIAWALFLLRGSPQRPTSCRKWSTNCMTPNDCCNSPENWQITLWSQFFVGWGSVKWPLGKVFCEDQKVTLNHLVDVFVGSIPWVGKFHITCGWFPQ